HSLANRAPCVNPPIPLLVKCYSAHHQPPSFPTRRSSDLGRARPDPRGELAGPGHAPGHGPLRREGLHSGGLAEPPRRLLDASARSEEHTSELQSRENLVCRLLLEKKNDAVVA